MPQFSLAVSKGLQSDHSQVYSHHKPLCFLASRDLAIKTINFFGFGGVEKVENEVDGTSGCSFFAGFMASRLFQRTQCFQGFAMAINRL